MSDQARAYVYRHSPYRGSLFAIHLALGDVANDLHENRLWMKAGRLATKARTTRQTVVGALARLAEDGFVERVSPETRQGRPVEYRFLMPEVPVVFEDEVSAQRTRRARTALKVSAPVTPLSAELTPGVGSGDTEPNPNQTPTEHSGAAPRRKPDHVFDALIEIEGLLPGDKITDTHRGALNRAAKELRKVGADAEEIHRRARAWPQRFPGATLTASALVRRWGQLARPAVDTRPDWQVWAEALNE